MPNSRCDIAIINPKDIAKIDDPLNLKVHGKWIKPDFILEFGTKKSAGSAEIFKKHLYNDIEKTAQSKIKGYVIHIHRNWVQSGGTRLKFNRDKYAEYEEVLKESLKKLASNQKAIILLIEIGNKGRQIAKEGKMKLFDIEEGRFKRININMVEEAVLQCLTGKQD
jgi:hypothetical protein